MPPKMNFDRPNYDSQEGMLAQAEEMARYFREDMPGTVSDKIPLYVHEVNYARKTLTMVLQPSAWMADRSGYMSNGAFCVALDETMGFLCLYTARMPMTPTVTMQLSLLGAIPLDKPLYIKAKSLSSDGSKLVVGATAWSGDMEREPVCTAVGIYFAPKAKA